MYAARRDATPESWLRPPGSASPRRQRPCTTARSHQTVNENPASIFICMRESQARKFACMPGVYIRLFGVPPFLSWPSFFLFLAGNRGGAMLHRVLLCVLGSGAHAEEVPIKCAFSLRSIERKCVCSSILR